MEQVQHIKHIISTCIEHVDKVVHHFQTRVNQIKSTHQGGDIAHQLDLLRGETLPKLFEIEARDRELEVMIKATANNLLARGVPPEIAMKKCEELTNMRMEIQKRFARALHFLHIACVGRDIISSYKPRL